MPKSCFLFGHADTPQSVLPFLVQAIEMEADKGISVFYVGYHGNTKNLFEYANKIRKSENNIVNIADRVK